MTTTKTPPPQLVTGCATHIEYCRALIASWPMLDVIDYLMAHYVIISVYLSDADADTDEMARVDAANRERAARYMAGY